jgi:hypothetical protein
MSFFDLAGLLLRRRITAVSPAGHPALDRPWELDEID